MEKSVLDLTVKMRNQKKGMTKTEVKDINGTFVVKLRGLNLGNKYFNTLLPLNEDDNNFYEQLNDIHYKRTARKLHDAGLEKKLFHFC